MKEEGKEKSKNEMLSKNAQNKFQIYWVFAMLGTLAISAYPIYMGVKVLRSMAMYGFVPQRNYPKYIIPYTPIAIAVMVTVFLMPVLLKKVKKYPLFTASGISLVVFFVAEFLFEQKVIVNGTLSAKLERWQMFMCYVSPETYQTRNWKAVDILIGEYSPTFKIHFYLISVVLILTILSCLYGFGQMVLNGNRKKCKVLAIQSVCSAFFLGLCIFACFTAFFRDGELLVSPLSAVLMGIFFLVLGVTVGTYVGSFLLGKKKGIAVGVPAAVGAVTTLAMYIGEMCLLSGNLYLFGTGFWFTGLPGIVLAPVDILIILAAGAVSGGISLALNRKRVTK